MLVIKLIGALCDLAVYVSFDSFYKRFAVVFDKLRDDCAAVGFIIEVGIYKDNIAFLESCILDALHELFLFKLCCPGCCARAVGNALSVHTCVVHTEVCEQAVPLAVGAAVPLTVAGIAVFRFAVIGDMEIGLAFAVAEL